MRGGDERRQGECEDGGGEKISKGGHLRIVLILRTTREERGKDKQGTGDEWDIRKDWMIVLSI